MMWYERVTLARGTALRSDGSCRLSLCSPPSRWPGSSSTSRLWQTATEARMRQCTARRC